jgi:hypothetical protein
MGWYDDGSEEQHQMEQQRRRGAQGRDMAARVRIRDEARARVRQIAFGDPVTNVCAGEGNPLRHAYFVRAHGDAVEVTDKAGTFADYGCEVIYPGHIPADDAAKLYEPFWQAQFGSRPTVECKP